LGCLEQSRVGLGILLSIGDDRMTSHPASTEARTSWHKHCGGAAVRASLSLRPLLLRCHFPTLARRVLVRPRLLIAIRLPLRRPHVGCGCPCPVAVVPVRLRFVGCGCPRPVAVVPMWLRLSPLPGWGRGRVVGWGRAGNTVLQFYRDRQIQF